MLEVKNLRKVYGPLVAVEELSFTLQPGDVFGFIGSNGAGKTTTIRMISTLLEPTSGTATINGADIWKDPMEVRRLIGYMPDFFGLYDDVKVWEYLDFFATIYRVPVNQRPAVIDNVLELTDLTVKRDAFVQSLSRGMQQRLCLARCLVHDPALLLLDEPASGLDPRARAELRELILELGRMGKIVIVSSHILSELSGFCNTVGIIEKGRLLASGPVKEVIGSIRTSRVLEVRFLEDAGAPLQFAKARAHVNDAQMGPEGQVCIDFVGTLEDQASLLEAFVAAGHRVVDFRETHADLEDVFMRLTTGALN
ncbi:MAG: ABC transporter ATP-binding protein [Fimbriimonadaceae bacterium]|nr:ABC transporter ATP-binding protein [Chthonomonadaceae bacterium]MCO5296176.1 ABC transporter ATP-binding protein [Fimbriimonadaceae bacterium]